MVILQDAWSEFGKGTNNYVNNNNNNKQIRSVPNGFFYQQMYCKIKIYSCLIIYFYSAVV